MIITGDCIQAMTQLSKVNLIVADPPYNIGCDYGYGFNDKRSSFEYYHWCQQWIELCYEKLLMGGALWIVIDDDHVCALRNMALRSRFCHQNWVIWYFKFGQYSEMNFSHNKIHLLHFVKYPDISQTIDVKCTWNPIRIESERQRLGDKRANPEGRVMGDVWEVPRVCGNFEERCTWHPCQLPEELVRRMVVQTSNEGDLVLDPFCGSGTTGVVCKRWNRKFIGIEQNHEYTVAAEKRINDTLEVMNKV